MHVVAFITNFRLLDNYADTLRLIEQRGGRCEVIALPWTGDPSSAVVPPGCDFPVSFCQPFTRFDEALVSRPTLLHIANAIVEAAPDFVLLPNMQSHPSCAMHSSCV